MLCHVTFWQAASQLITVKFWAEFIAWFHFCRRLKRIILYFFCKMEKNEFRAVIKYLHEKFKPKEKRSWIMFIAYLHHRLQLYTIEWMNLNVVIRPYVMHFIRDVFQLRLLRQSSIKSTILTDRWVKVRELVEAYHMAQWFQFCMNNWVWKSYRQDGCRVCLLWTISAIVWWF